MSKISDKYAQLKSQNIDLGNDLHPGQPDMDAGYGGVYRQYALGNIYYHPVMGDTAHEVHGGILALYLAHGGPGVDPATGKRLFGFPLTDELRTLLQTPVSQFETGEIFWTAGTGGCVLTGGAYRCYAANGGALVIGLPITSNVPVAGGEAIYSERGCVWSTDAVPNGQLFSNLQPPLMGNPLMLDPTPPPQVFENEQERLVNVGGLIGPVGPITPRVSFTGPEFQAIPMDQYNALTKWRPTLLTDIWAGRLSLVNTGARDLRIPLVPVISNQTSYGGSNMFVYFALQLAPTPPAQTPDRTLFDLEIAMSAPNTYYPLSPHCLYTKTSWDNFGLLHITDLHLSKRINQWRQDFLNFGMPDSANAYTNTHDQFRDFIHYANHLHSIGLADCIMATGDLVDFKLEVGDDSYSGNYARFRRMLLGQPFEPGVQAGEELLVPILTSFGNHDHRLNSYDIISEIGTSILSTVFNEYKTFNLTDQEAYVLQGRTISNLGHQGHIEYGPLEHPVSIPLSWLKYGFDDDFLYFTKYFGRRTFTTDLGPHRIVMIDTGNDAGLPDPTSSWQEASLIVDFLKGEPDTRELISGCPDSIGYEADEPELIKEALADAGATGLVFVGVHSPPIAPKGGYNNYFRETEHPTADPALAKNYLAGNKLDSGGWIDTGTPYFKVGDIEGSLDFGIATAGALDFLKTCAGVGSNRPIDLLLCGHHHDRVEYRIRWDGGQGQLQYFMDFYTENPSAYNNTAYWLPNPTNSGGNVPTYFSQDMHILVSASAPHNGQASTAVYRTLSGQNVTYHTLTVPPYASPLNSSANPAAWWQQHRPLLMQTAALGPIDPCQRYTDDTVPEPTFQGFRVIVVNDNVIKRIRYVTNVGLRAANFVLPWEQEDAPPHWKFPLPQPVLKDLEATQNATPALAHP